jgi:hypothetical protein
MVIAFVLSVGSFFHNFLRKLAAESESKIGRVAGADTILL